MKQKVCKHALESEKKEEVHKQIWITNILSDHHAFSVTVVWVFHGHGTSKGDLYLFFVMMKENKNNSVKIATEEFPFPF